MPKVHRNDIFYKRIAAVSFFLLAAFAVIVYKLADLQIVHGAEKRALADDQHSFFQKLLPGRGEIKITDKLTGQTQPVATNKKSYLVYAVPQDIGDATRTADSLAPILGMASREIAEKLSAKDKKYVPIKKQLSDEQRQKIEALKLLGLHFDSEDVRFYPEQNLLSHVLGFVGYNKDDKKAGLYGLERSFERELSGREGFVSEEKGIGGAWIFGSKRQIVPAMDGANLILTIDRTIQFKAESVLRDTVTKNGADSGTVIVINPKTGAVLAMAGYPDFNPNEYNKVENPAVFSNEATMGSYEPGSVYKPLTMAAAIDEGKVTPDTTYVDRGEVVVNNAHIKNSDEKAHGVQTMTQVLESSLNTGAIFAKDQIGNSEFYKYVKRFGFGDPTGIELPEARGNLDNLKADIEVNFDTATFGQGITATPIQMLQAFTALANGGKMMKPYIVQSVIYPGGSVKNTEPEMVRQAVSKKTADTVSAMLVSVVENGHGKKAGVPGYWIGGKTGTAQVPRKDGKPGYEENNNIGTFIGYGPIENPQFLMLVRVDHPRDVHFAEVTAAPAWGELASFILNYYKIPPTREVK